MMHKPQSVLHNAVLFLGIATDVEFLDSVLVTAQVWMQITAPTGEYDVNDKGDRVRSNILLTQRDNSYHQNQKNLLLHVLVLLLENESKVLFLYSNTTVSFPDLVSGAA